MFEQTKPKPQEIIEFKMNKQWETFSFNPPINLVEQRKWLLAVCSFEATNSVFNLTNKKNSFSITIPGPWNTEDCEELINELNKLLELRSENDIELHVKEVRKRGTRIKIGDNEHPRLSDLETRKNSIIKEMKGVKYKD